VTPQRRHRRHVKIARALLGISWPATCHKPRFQIVQKLPAGCPDQASRTLSPHSPRSRNGHHQVRDDVSLPAVWGGEWVTGTTVTVGRPSSSSTTRVMPAADQAARLSARWPLLSCRIAYWVVPQARRSEIRWIARCRGPGRPPIAKDVEDLTLSNGDQATLGEIGRRFGY
jgi:hypothetical protein